MLEILDLIHKLGNDGDKYYKPIHLQCLSFSI